LPVIVPFPVGKHLNEVIELNCISSSMAQGLTGILIVFQLVKIYDIIGYLLYLQHTHFDLKVLLFVATCFGINIPSSGHFSNVANSYQIK
jgi:hypothetical protein